MKRLGGIVALAVVAWLGLWAYGGRFGDGANAARLVIPSSESPPASSTTVSSKPIHGWASDPRSAAVAAMRSDYERADDLQAFFDRALLNPRGGGVFYAKRASFDCVSVTGARRNDPAASEKISDVAMRVRAAADLDRAIVRCSGIASAGNSTRLLAAMKASIDDGDPEMAPWEAHLQAVYGKGTKPRFDLAIDMLRRALDLGDPYYLLDALVRVTHDAGSFDGEPLDEASRRALVAAAVVMHCDLGAQCVGDSYSIFLCYVGTGCGTSRAAIAVQDPTYPEPVRQLVVRHAAELTNAAREGTLVARFGR